MCLITLAAAPDGAPVTTLALASEGPLMRAAVAKAVAAITLRER
jgi:hypothetical protein